MDEKILELIKSSQPKYLHSLKEFIPWETTIFYSWPFWDNNEVYWAINCLLNGKWLAHWENCLKFEAEFAKYVWLEESLFVNSGSSANLLMVSALKSKYWLTRENTQVITPVVSFPTTVNPFIQNGFDITFVDIELNTLNIDLDEIEKKIDSSKEFKVLCFAHVLGNPPDMDKLQELIKKHNILFLEDSCDALWSEYDGKKLWTFGIMSSCSFYAAHHICTGEGGMVSSADKDIMAIVRKICSRGRDCYCKGIWNLIPNWTCGKRFSNWLKDDEVYQDMVLDHRYIYSEIGYNLKPLDLQWAMWLEQVKKLPIVKQNRQNNYKKLFDIFSKYSDKLRIIQATPKADVSWFWFPIYCNDESLKWKLVAFLEKNKIQTRNYFAGNILRHPAYKSISSNKNDFPNADKVYKNVFFIWCHPWMQDAHFDYIKEKMDEFMNT